LFDGGAKWQAALDNFGELYDRLLKAARVGAVTAATGMRPWTTEQPPYWGAKGDKPFIWPRDAARRFPQAGVMIDRIARFVLQEVLSLLAHPSYQEALRKQKLEEIATTGRRWIARAMEIGFDIAPSAADATGFLDWLKDIEQSNERTVMRYGLGDILTKGILSSIAYAASSAKAAALIPADFYDVLAKHHLPFDQDIYGLALATEFESWRFSASHHQMLGHAPSCQDAEQVTNPDILLLQLCYDREIGIGFGDVGAASFWIKPADLAARRFENAWAEIVGH
jgi:hypothetical protein